MIYTVKYSYNKVKSVLPKIQSLIDLNDFESLFELHENIFDLDKEIQASDQECHAPSSASVKDPYPRHKINIFHESETKLTICLPPKAGTTNWQNALASIHNQTGRGLIPRLTKDDYKDATAIKAASNLMVVNARNPFGRLLSAWRDKFSTQASPSRQNIFIPAMDVFKSESDEIPNGFVRSFESFIEYLASNPSVFAQNRHWQSIYYQCSPCHFDYDMIVQLENIDTDFDAVWNGIGFDSPNIKGQYQHSPLKKNPEEYYYSKIPKDTIKRIYMVKLISIKLI